MTDVVGPMQEEMVEYFAKHEHGKTTLELNVEEVEVSVNEC